MSLIKCYMVDGYFCCYAFIIFAMALQVINSITTIYKRPQAHKIFLKQIESDCLPRYDEFIDI